MVNRKELAKTIINLRKKKQYSQRKLAMISSVSNSTVSRIESATSDADPETLKKLAPCLGVSYEELMKVAGYIKEYSNITAETLKDEDFKKILPTVLTLLTQQILQYDDGENKELTDKLDFNKEWDKLDDLTKSEMFNVAMDKIYYNKPLDKISLYPNIPINEATFKSIKKLYLNSTPRINKMKEAELTNSDIKEPYKKNTKEKYPEVHDVEEAMKIILEQPGLMLKGSILSDESKIILANAIQMGLRTAEELEKKKNKGDVNE